MYSKVNTCVLQGLNGNLVEVEADLSRGLPMFNIVGLPDAAIKESKERVRSAVKNSGYEFPLSRITINLAPANLKKDGSQMDLAIAIGILRSASILNDYDYENTIFIGELSLDGSLNRIEGALPMVISMRESGFRKFLVPFANKDECSIIKDVDIIPIKSLFEACGFINGDIIIDAHVYDRVFSSSIADESDADFTDIKGQDSLKRAMEVAAAGGHNLLIIGPPGSGKTMAARRLPSILPELGFEESIEVTKIYSITGDLSSGGLVKTRPFRAPHHSASGVSIIGGGRIPKPGEVSLAHNGVLFFDELPEFQKSVLEVLRQPLEDGFVQISRANASLSYPSRFMFVASMNPCPCGYYGDPLHSCTCSQASIEKYLGKISNPLLDRIDMHIEVMPVKYDDLNKGAPARSSTEMRLSVEKARSIQEERFNGVNIFSNSSMGNKELKRYCRLNKDCEAIMKTAFEKFRLSGRSYSKILKVARTIADMDSEESIMEKHLLEAISYRGLDKKYWG